LIFLNNIFICQRLVIFWWKKAHGERFSYQNSRLCFLAAVHPHVDSTRWVQRKLRKHSSQSCITSDSGFSLLFLWFRVSREREKKRNFWFSLKARKNPGRALAGKQISMPRATVNMTRRHRRLLLCLFCCLWSTFSSCCAASVARWEESKHNEDFCAGIHVGGEIRWWVHS
jgi:hypothetical protein